MEAVSAVKTCPATTRAEDMSQPPLAPDRAELRARRGWPGRLAEQCPLTRHLKDTCTTTSLPRRRRRRHWRRGTRRWSTRRWSGGGFGGFGGFGVDDMSHHRSRPKTCPATTRARPCQVARQERLAK